MNQKETGSQLETLEVCVQIGSAAWNILELDSFEHFSVLFCAMHVAMGDIATQNGKIQYVPDLPFGLGLHAFNLVWMSSKQHRKTLVLQIPQEPPSDPVDHFPVHRISQTQHPMNWELTQLATRVQWQPQDNSTSSTSTVAARHGWSCRHGASRPSCFRTTSQWRCGQSSGQRLFDRRLSPGPEDIWWPGDDREIWPACRAASAASAAAVLQVTLKICLTDFRCQDYPRLAKIQNPSDPTGA